MKISASPFEPPVEPLPAEAAERARETEVVSAAEETPAAAVVEETHSGLDPSTRESLGKLAMLIRHQMKELPKLETTSDEEDEEAPRGRRDDRESKHSGEVNKSGTLREITSIAIEPEHFPEVLRAERVLEEASRQRGSKIYSAQKSKDAVELILVELAKRAA